MVLKQILKKYGILNEFFTDNRTVFTYKSIPNPTDEHDTYTQFAYACKSLGISIKTSSVPQKKVESKDSTKHFKIGCLKK